MTNEPMARIWRGAVRRGDADRYADYIRGTGVKEYAATPGNRAVLMSARLLIAIVRAREAISRSEERSGFVRPVIDTA